MASLFDAVENPFVQNTINSVNTPSLLEATDVGQSKPTHITVSPEVKAPVDSKIQRIIDELFGLNGKERYQLWPEKVVREGLSAAHDAATEGLPLPGLRREDLTDIPAPSGPTNDSTWLGKKIGMAPVAWQPNNKVIEQAQAMSALAGSGGLGGAGSEAGVALGSTPFLRPALKYGEKLYKGKEGQQHLDVIPNDLYPTFQKQAMSGEDISNFNFGFLNHKGQFMDREAALKYAIDNGLVEPQAAQFGALTSTLMADSSKPGVAIEAMAQSQPLKQAIKPIEAYHGTNQTFDKFQLNNELGIHFGTSEQANSRLAYINKNGEGSHIIPAEIELNNPLRLTDNGDFKIGNTYSALLDNPNFTKSEVQAAYDTAVKKKSAQPLRELIQSKGYDGVQYLNKYEGLSNEALNHIHNYEKLDYNSGKRKLLSDDELRALGAKDSYISFKPNTVKSKITGQTLFADSSKPGAAISAMANTNKPVFDFSTGASSGSKSVKIGPTEITYGVNPKNNDVELSLIRTDKYKRGQGAGRAAIEQFLNEADSNNKRVLLNADPMDKSTSKNKLVDFYKSLGFERNSGQNKDFTTRAEYIRNPVLKADNKAGLGVAALNTNKPFYSAVENAVAGAKQPKADAQQWLSFLKNQPGVKQEELQHLGLDKLQGPITKDDLLKAVQEGQPQIKEVFKDKGLDKEYFNKTVDNLMDEEISSFKEANNKTPNDEEILKLRKDVEKYVNENPDEFNIGLKDDTKYHSYQLPGGENYREMLLTLPDKEPKFGVFNGNYQVLPKEFATAAEAREAGKAMGLEGKASIREISSPQDAYRSSHWDEPNVLAHIRMNDRMIDGKKSLHLEEIQSDIHQEARKKGYKGELSNEDKQLLDDLKIKNKENHEKLRNAAKSDDDAGFDKYNSIHKEYMGQINELENKAKQLANGLPNFPFKKTWDELALKKAITHAVKNGYDQISWTPGEAQAARYDLSKQVDSIKYLKNDDGTYNIVPFKNDRPVHSVEGENIKPEKLPDIVGKEVAEKIVNGHGDREQGSSDIRVLSGQDLKVGGQGMKAFYDKMLVDKANALVKKHGGKVEKNSINNPYQVLPGYKGKWDIVSQDGKRIKTLTSKEEAEKEIKGLGNSVHVLKITPELREHVLKKGFPLFSAGVPIFTPIDGNPFESKK